MHFVISNGKQKQKNYPLFLIIYVLTMNASFQIAQQTVKIIANIYLCTYKLCASPYIPGLPLEISENKK